MASASEIEFRAAPSHAGERAVLVQAMRDEMAVIYDGLNVDYCELKRMYVVSRARGRGVARRLLGALEHAARQLGYTVARLDTGPCQPAARRLYESAGYVAIPNVEENPVASFAGEKPQR